MKAASERCMLMIQASAAVLMLLLVGGRLILNLSFRNPPQAAKDDREQNTNQNKMKREF